MLATILWYSNKTKKMSSQNKQPNNPLFADTFYFDQHPIGGADLGTFPHPRTDEDEYAEKLAAIDVAKAEEVARLNASTAEAEKQRKRWRALDPKERRQRYFEDIIADQPIEPGVPPPGLDSARLQAEFNAKSHRDIGGKMIELSDKKPAVYGSIEVYDQENRPEEEKAIDEVPWIGRKAG